MLEADESGVNSRVLTKICMIAGMRYYFERDVRFVDVDGGNELFEVLTSVDGEGC